MRAYACYARAYMVVYGHYGAYMGAYGHYIRYPGAYACYAGYAMREILDTSGTTLYILK